MKPLIAAALVSALAASAVPVDQPATPQPVFRAAALDDQPTLIRLRAIEARHLRHTQKPRQVRRTKVRVNGTPGVWLRLADCESSGRWHIVSPPFYGGLQIMAMNSTHYGFARADLLSPGGQVRLARLILRDQGVGAWPVCGPRVGLSMRDAA